MAVVLITGAGGLIGSHLARRLTELGHDVVGIGRRAPRADFCRWGEARPFGTSLADVARRYRPDAAIHCAYDPRPGSAQENERGTRQWAEELGAAGQARQTFLSSISARPDALAPYGLLKYRLEQWFLDRGAIVFRPGLVIGPGGLFARMVAFMRRFPVVPLVDGGRTRVYFTGVDMLADIVAGAALAETGCGAWNVHQAQPTTMRALLDEVCQAAGLRRLFLPVPYRACLAAAAILQHAPGLGIRTDNVRGLRQNDNLALASDIAALGGQEEDLAELVRRALCSSRSG